MHSQIQMPNKQELMKCAHNFKCLWVVCWESRNDNIVCFSDAFAAICRFLTETVHIRAYFSFISSVIFNRMVFIEYLLNASMVNIRKKSMYCKKKMAREWKYYTHTHTKDSKWKWNAFETKQRQKEPSQSTFKQEYI